MPSVRCTRDWSPLDCLAYAQLFRHVGASPLHGVAAGIVESGLTCDARNPRSSATGLGQWMGHGDPPLYFGHLTRAQLIAQGLSWQIARLAERYEPRAGKLGSLGRIYAIIAAPSAVDDGLVDDEPIYAETGLTRYGDTSRAWRDNPDWHLLGGPVTIRSLALCARVLPSTPRFYELAERITGAPVPWLNLWSRETRAETAGLITRADVISYQNARGLRADGEVGQKTIAQLVLDYDEGSIT